MAKHGIIAKGLQREGAGSRKENGATELLAEREAQVIEAASSH